MQAVEGVPVLEFLPPLGRSLPNLERDFAFVIIPNPVLPIDDALVVDVLLQMEHDGDSVDSPGAADSVADKRGAATGHCMRAGVCADGEPVLGVASFYYVC